MNLTDSLSNSYTQRTKQSNGSYEASIWDTTNPSVSSAVTFSVSQACFPSIAAFAFSGVATSSVFDQQSGASGLNLASLQPGSITPTNANSLFFSGVASATTNNVFTIDSGFTGVQSNHGVDIQTGGAYLIQSGGPTGVNPTWSQTNGGIRAAVMATYNPAAAAAGTTVEMNCFASGRPIIGPNIMYAPHLMGPHHERVRSLWL